MELDRVGNDDRYCAPIASLNSHRPQNPTQFQDPFMHRRFSLDPEMEQSTPRRDGELGGNSRYDAREGGQDGYDEMRGVGFQQAAQGQFSGRGQVETGFDVATEDRDIPIRLGATVSLSLSRIAT